MSVIINNSFIFFLSLYTILWGTGWNIKYINLNISEFFFPIIFSYILIKTILDKNFFKIRLSSVLFVSLFFLLILSFFIKGYFEINQFDQSTNDVLYLYGYTIKLLLFIFFALLVKKIITNEKDLKFYINCSLFILVPLYIYLHYRYMYVYQTYHTGVSLDGTGLKNGKNSFGGMIALIYPFIFCKFIKNPKNFLNILSIIIVVVASYYLYSRSMTIVVIFETIIISLVLLNSFKKLIISVILILVPIIFLFQKNQEDINEYFSKSQYTSKQEISIIDNEFEDKARGPNYLIFDTHRGWLLHEALIGAKNNYFFGSGISTFRIRESNYGSKTETHNDLALVLYETGIFGFLFLLISIGIISIKSLNLYKKTNNLHFLAAFSSLFGLVLLMNFSNFINTFMFAIIVGLSLAIQNFKKKDE